jgi:predicted chitinase
MSQEAAYSVSADGAITLTGKNLKISKIGDTGSVDVIKPNVDFSMIGYINRMDALLFDGKINQDQMQCVKIFIAAMTGVNFSLRRVYIEYLAYALATTYHETARTMLPIEEYGKGAGRPYGEPDSVTGKTYYGRGYVQLTWKENYDNASREILDANFQKGNVDLVNNPELAMTIFNAAQIALFGMLEGWFTGKSLDDYKTETGFNYVGARRIINGTDKAQTIAGYAHEFESAIRVGLGQHIDRMTVRLGSSGDDVRELQLLLELNPDGIYGQKTESEVKRFQSENSLANDGIVGDATWTKIEAVFY